MPGAIRNHSVVDEASIGSVLKAVNHALRPLSPAGKGETVDGAATAAPASLTSGSVEISAGIDIHIAYGAGAVGAALETVEQVFGPDPALQRELIHRTEVVRAGVVGRPVEISGCVDAEGAIRKAG